MGAFLLKRAVQGIVTIFAASIVIFLVMEVLPGDPAAFMLGLNAQPDTVAALRDQLGLNAPPLDRYIAWIGGMFAFYVVVMTAAVTVLVGHEPRANLAQETGATVATGPAATAKGEGGVQRSLHQVLRHRDGFRLAGSE